MAPAPERIDGARQQTGDVFRSDLILAICIVRLKCTRMAKPWG